MQRCFQLTMFYGANQKMSRRYSEKERYKIFDAFKYAHVYAEPKSINHFLFDLQILEAKGDIKAAIPILQRGAILDPESRAIQQVITEKLPTFCENE